MKKKQMASIMLALGGSCLFTQNLLADHPTLSLGDGHAGPLTTISAQTLGARQTAFSLLHQVIFNDELSGAELEGYADAGGEVHSVESVYSTSLGGALGVTDDLTVGFQLPYISRQGIREAHHGHGDDHDDDHGDEHGNDHGDEAAESIAHRGDASGVGDTTLYGQYRFWSQPETNLQAALLFGIKAPTGTTHESSADGERFETEHQPGSGSWDLFTGLALSRSTGRVGLHTNILYTFASEGSQATNLGDVFNYNAALTFRASGESTEPHEHQNQHGQPHGHARALWDLMLEINGDWREKVEKPAGADPNTGGNIVYLSAATRANWGNGWSASLSLGLPVIKDLNGIQSEPKARVLIGLSKGF